MNKQAASPQKGEQIERFKVYSHREIKALICGTYHPTFEKVDAGLVLILTSSMSPDLKNIAPKLCSPLPCSKAPESDFKRLFNDNDRMVLLYVLKELCALNGCRRGRRKEPAALKRELHLCISSFAALRQISSKRAKPILQHGLETLRKFGLFSSIQKERGAFIVSVTWSAAYFLKEKGNYLSLNCKAFSIDLKRHPLALALYFHLSVAQFVQRNSRNKDKNSVARVSGLIENTALARYKGRNIADRIIKPLIRDLEHLHVLELIQWDGTHTIKRADDAINYRAL